MREHHTVDVTGMTVLTTRYISKTEDPGLCSFQFTGDSPSAPTTKSRSTRYGGRLAHPGPDGGKWKLEKGKPYETGGERRGWGEGKEREK